MTRKSSERGTPSPADFGKDGRLRREDFTRESIDRLRALAQANGVDWVISHEERDANRTAFIQKHLKRGQPVWVFGYGSLMWNPAIHVAATRPARIFGYHRAFCLSLTLGRGSTEKPGLMLGLDKGGSCVGIAHKIAASQVESELEILWMREMLGNTYAPRLLKGEVDGKPQTLLTFAANKAHERYIGTQPIARAAKLIARSEGILGTNRDYLYNTVRELDALGIGDGPLHELEAAVRRIAREPKET